MSYLELTDIRIEYDRGLPVLDGFQLAVEEGELVSLLGPSGCGKTTTLRTVAGFIQPVAGRVTVGGKDITALPPNRRDIGLVFQSYALFPHLTVFQNVAFGLQMRKQPKDQIERRVLEALALVDMAAFAERRPAQLSGGQRQRVAVARAIVIEPALLLMDEPLSNLDAKLRVGMRTEIRRLQQRLGTTTLYVTHDQVEALTLSDRIVVMNKGNIEQIGPPEEIFQTPRTAFVADFMGFDNRFDGQLTLDGGRPTVQTAAGAFVTERTVHVQAGPVRVFFRPEKAHVTATAQPNSVAGSVLLRTFRGVTVEYLVRTELGEFIIYADDDSRFLEGDNVYVVLPAKDRIVMKG
ncbi:MAG: ABC transporter ATP-binding protein [Caldilineaceae bacterium]